METQTCKKCNTEKSISDFYLSRGKPVTSCKSCDKKRISENYKKDSEKKKQQSSKRYYSIREELNRKKREITSEKNKDIVCKNCFKLFDRKKQDQVYCCLKCWREDHRRQNLDTYREKARELHYKKKNDKDYLLKRKQRRSRYYENNKQKIIKYCVKYRLKRYREDPIFNIITKLRRRIHQTLRAKNIEKNYNWNSAYGCSPSKLKKHIECQFTEGMTWEKILNGEIHIDHIKPISLATTEEEVYLLNHYTNLQPLWAEDNLLKSNSF